MEIMKVTQRTEDLTTEIDATKAMDNNDLSLEQGEIIIEEISRNHKLLHRHKLKQNEISIGREITKMILF